MAGVPAPQQGWNLLLKKTASGSGVNPLAKPRNNRHFFRAAVSFSLLSGGPPFLRVIELLDNLLGHGFRRIAAVISIPVICAWTFAP